MTSDHGTLLGNDTCHEKTLEFVDTYSRENLFCELDTYDSRRDKIGSCKYSSFSSDMLMALDRVRPKNRQTDPGLLLSGTDIKGGSIQYVCEIY